VPDVDVGKVVVEVRQRADRTDKPGSGRERTGQEVGADPVGDDAPVFDALGLVA